MLFDRVTCDHYFFHGILIIEQIMKPASLKIILFLNSGQHLKIKEVNQPNSVPSNQVYVETLVHCW